MLLFQLLRCPQERPAVRGTHHKAWQPFHSLKEGGLGDGVALFHCQEQDSASPHFQLTPAQASRTPTVLMFGYFLILSREDVKNIYISNTSGKRGHTNTGWKQDISLKHRPWAQLLWVSTSRRDPRPVSEGLPKSVSPGKGTG